MLTRVRSFHLDVWSFLAPSQRNTSFYDPLSRTFSLPLLAQRFSNLTELSFAPSFSSSITCLGKLDSILLVRSSLLSSAPLTSRRRLLIFAASSYAQITSLRLSSEPSSLSHLRIPSSTSASTSFPLTLLRPSTRAPAPPSQPSPSLSTLFLLSLPTRID